MANVHGEAHDGADATGAVSANAAVPATGLDPRSIPGLGRDRRKTNVRGVMIIIVIVVVLAIVATSLALFLKRAGDAYLAHKQAARDAPTRHQTVDPDLTGYKEKVEAGQAASAAEAASAAAAAAAMPTPSGARGTPNQGATAAGNSTAGSSGGTTSTQAAPVDPRLTGDVLVKFAGATERLPAAPRASDSTATRMFARDGLDESLAASRLQPVKAGFLPDLSLLLKRGAMIPCGQFTDIVSTHAGLASCHVTEDVYSADGKTLLVERGSEATGEQRKVILQGQASIFVVWTRIDTPNGVSIDLDSPATNALGATGIDADVDTHFWARFGGAIMLSVIGDAGQALSNLTDSGNGNRIQFSNTTSQTQQLASDTLKNTINIPPTAISHHGAAINIFVARDVDFGSVYELVQR